MSVSNKTGERGGTISSGDVTKTGDIVVLVLSGLAGMSLLACLVLVARRRRS